MRRRSIFHFGLCLLVGCSRCGGGNSSDPGAVATNGAAGPVATGPVASGAPASPSSSSSPGSSGSPGATAPKTAAEIAKDAKPPVAADDLDRGLARITTSKGNLVVWSEPDGEMSLVLAGYEAKPGELVGGSSAKIIRRTSGRVGAVAAVVAEAPGDASDAGNSAANDAGNNASDVAIAWASGLGESNGGQLIALVYASVDLARVSAPITLGIVKAPIAQQAHVALAKNPKAGGVVAMHQGPGASCTLLGHPTECLTFDVKVVSPAGKIDRVGGSKLHGGPSPEFYAIDLDGQALAVYASSMRGGRTIEPIVVPYVAGETAPAFDLPVCGGLAGYAPDLHRGTKGELVSVCLGSRPEKGPCAKPVRGDDPDRCPTVAISSSDGKPITPKGKDANVLKVECAAGKQRLVSAGGDVTLASTSPLLTDFTTRCP